MAIHPDSRFPLRPSDQADVIRIYLELMRERHPADRESDIAINRSQGPRPSSNHPWVPRELLDLD